MTRAGSRWSRRFPRVRWIVLGLWLVATPVEAQHTGGSFGSGGWDSTSHGDESSSSWESSSSSSSSSYGSASADEEEEEDEDYGGSSSGEFHPLVLLLLLPLVLLALLIFYAHWVRELGPRFRRWRQGRERRLSPVDVAVYSVAIGAGHARAIQRKLEALARNHHLRDAASRRRLLLRVIRELSELQPAWAYVGGALVGPRLARQSARETFQGEVADLRSRFRHETLRGTDDGLVEREAPADLAARAEEGEGLCVVSAVVAAEERLPEPRTTRLGTVGALLRLKSPWIGDVVALEVIWSPSREEDRMSSFELETL